MRLDKFISKATELSRKDCKKILHAGEVTVNGKAKTQKMAFFNLKCGSTWGIKRVIGHG